MLAIQQFPNIAWWILDYTYYELSWLL